MQPFIHLHVHSQYSVLDGQASIKALVDKAIANGMKGIALTDHGNMFGIKEFYNYCNSINSGTEKDIKVLKKQIAEAESADEVDAAAVEELRRQLAEAQARLFKPIFGCEMYVAEKTLYDRTSKHDTGRHLIVLAKNLKGYHNLVKLVSKAWTDGFYSHPRTDKEQLERYHEGLMVCSACLGGEIPKLILNGQIDEARKTAQWFKGVFGDDFYLELQRHKATVARANHETFPLQQEVNAVLKQFSEELGIKLVCTVYSLHSVGFDSFFGAESIVGIDVHPESFGDTGNIASHISVGMDTQLFPLELCARGAVVHVAYSHHHQSESQFGYGVRVLSWRVHHAHVVCRGRFKVYVVVASTSAYHDFQLLGSLQYFCVDYVAADNQGIGIGHSLEEFGFFSIFFQQVQFVPSFFRYFADAVYRNFGKRLVCCYQYFHIF